MDTLDTKELEAAAEGILFAAGEPVHIDRVCLALEIGRAEAEQVLRRLMDYYAFERRGGGERLAAVTMRRYLERGMHYLSEYAESDCLSALLDLCAYVTERNR